MDFHTSDTAGLMKITHKFLKPNEDFAKVIPSPQDLNLTGSLFFKSFRLVLKPYSATE